MHLRPHHILCIQKFTGHGYNEAFTLHMTALTAALREKPEAPVVLVRGCDDLCQVCPHNTGDTCASLEKVERMDRRVLEACGLSCGEGYSWDRLAEMGRREIFETEWFERICGSCQWYALCRSTRIPSESYHINETVRKP